MDNIKVPFCVDTQIATFEGEVSAEEIDAGLATLKHITTSRAWYEPVDGEYVLITDPQRIAELESRQ